MSSPEPTRRAGELTVRELLRWLWRQLTSMRTALILLLLLALAAIPGSIIPQSNIDALKTANWKTAHPKLTPIYERLQLFAVYDSPWFSAIYILLVLSLVGCIIPRCFVYLRAIRNQPPKAPRNLSRLADHTTWTTSEEPDELLARAAGVLKKRRYRVATGHDADAVSAEKGYLREVGNLLFHLSVLLVLVGFAMGGLLGYKGGVIVVEGGGFSNLLNQYDDYDPGSLFDPDTMEPFSFDISRFDAQWLVSGPRAGMAYKFVSHLRYQESPDAPVKTYDLKVNHPLKIGSTEIFLIGHGYAPSFTITDGDGNVTDTGPVPFLPLDQTFRSVGVVKVPDASPKQLGLEGEFYPTYATDAKGFPYSAFGNALDPRVSLLAYAGDLGLDDGVPQSVYSLRKDGVELLHRPNGKIFRLDLKKGQTMKLPDGLGSVRFDGFQRWNKIQISRTPGTHLALAGVLLALLGLMGSLFIRPRRVWLRARREDGVTVVEIAGLDRSGGGDTLAELEALKVLLEEKR
ncbi:ResB-related putative cytochrome C-type biogenesis protein [metagenome]|uniref:ResB-related putative cytochrome C-type biogenesis protein n=1 Tax=metagenome TaxID=256318 RepID=A0A2P2BXM2_9ZZZZ